LVGCTPGGEVTPTPTVIIPSASATPTPRWTDDEQGAVDAVQRYLEVWTRISQDLVGEDWNDIWEVAGDPTANNALAQRQMWGENDWHLIGGPEFTVDTVTPGPQDHLGSRHHVYGCFSIEHGYIVDNVGNRVGDRGMERSVVRFLVLQLVDNKFIVLEDLVEEGEC